MHGQHQYQNVCCDGETCIRVPGLVQTDTLRVKRLVPGAAEGMALPDRQGQGYGHVAGHDGHESEAAPAEPFLDEDAEVEQEH